VPTAAAEIWQHAKDVLLPWEGAASRLLVLGIPTVHYGAVLDAFAQFVGSPDVVTFDSYSGDPQPLDAVMRQALISRPGGSHQLTGLRAGRENVSLFLDPHADCFDAELVFWSDQLFPHPENEAACVNAIEPYVLLAESVRSLSPLSECVISSHEAGNPRHDREKPWTFWW